MKVEQWTAVVHQLLETHFGIGINDTGLQEHAQDMALAVYPFVAVNEVAGRYGLDRIDVKGPLPAGPLTKEDEASALSRLDGQVELGDQPASCPHCGCRSDFEELPDQLQYHRCLNSSCQHHFITCEPEVDDCEDAA